MNTIHEIINQIFISELQNHCYNINSNLKNNILTIEFKKENWIGTLTITQKDIHTYDCVYESGTHKQMGKVTVKYDLLKDTVEYINDLVPLLQKKQKLNKTENFWLVL